MEGLSTVRGMRDLFGDELNRIEYIRQVFEKNAQLFGYSKVELPIVEYFKLFEVKSGEEIRESMYVFLDKAGRELALRPEITPSIVRTYIEHFQHFPKPIRLYYYGTVYRYDEPQYGRYREFRQAGVEMIGSSGLLSDLEVLLLLGNIYKDLGLISKIRLKINNIGIYRKLFNCEGINERQQEHLLHLIDKNRKDEALKLLENSKIYRTLAELFDGNESNAIEESNKIGCSISDNISYTKLILENIKNFIPNSYINLGFVRGLAYYTGIIFEVEHPSVPFSIAGGGRYDNLVEVYGATHTPAVGFAIGVDRTSFVLEKDVYSLNEKSNRAIILLLVQDTKTIQLGLQILELLHEVGVAANFSLKSSTSVSKLIPDFLKEGYSHLVIIGNKEVEEGYVTVKDLLTRKQYELRIPLSAESLKQIF
ncbi:MAG: histidine--tRNA ligase [Sulfolobales archaeon]|nr:histidine--tRNA ligase [Sulfolobales archaeon]MCG2884072.1 histidine--tRNA ligase [Sulfolobales archaeon]MCG2907711.1 histidine--tRNA ligase [Sulfolobales archaeon]